MCTFNWGASFEKLIPLFEPVLVSSLPLKPNPASLHRQCPQITLVTSSEQYSSHSRLIFSFSHPLLNRWEPASAVRSLLELLVLFAPRGTAVGRVLALLMSAAQEPFKPLGSPIAAPGSPCWCLQCCRVAPSLLRLVIRHSLTHQMPLGWMINLNPVLTLSPGRLLLRKRGKHKSCGFRAWEFGSWWS